MRIISCKDILMKQSISFEKVRKIKKYIYFLKNLKVESVIFKFVPLYHRAHIVELFKENQFLIPGLLRIIKETG